MVGTDSYGAESAAETSFRRNQDIAGSSQIQGGVTHTDDVSGENEIRMPFDDDPELTELIDRFVTPGNRYLELLHGNYLAKPEQELAQFLAELIADAHAISDEEIEVLLSSEWRSRLTAGYLIAAAPREQLVPQIGQLLIESQLVYAGQGYCIALASIGTASAADQLTAYLDRWLPKIDARGDQGWAMAALVSLDEEGGTNFSDRFLGPSGPWATWCQAHRDLDGQVRHTRALLKSLGAAR